MIYEVKIKQVIAYVNHDGDAALLRETLKRLAGETRAVYNAQEGDYASPMFVVGGFYFDLRWFFSEDNQYSEPEITEFPYGNPLNWAINDIVKHHHRIVGPVA